MGNEEFLENIFFDGNDLSQERGGGGFKTETPGKFLSYFSYYWKQKLRPMRPMGVCGGRDGRLKDRFRFFKQFKSEDKYTKKI